MQSCPVCPLVVSIGGVSGENSQNDEKPLGLDRGFSQINQKPLFFMIFSDFSQNARIAIASRIG